MKKTEKELKRKQALVAAEDEARAAKKVYDVSYNDSLRKLDIWIKAQTKLNKLRDRAIKCGIYHWR